MNKDIAPIIDGLLEVYKSRVTSVSKIIKAMVSSNMVTNQTAIQNDHIAFRTLGVAHLGINSLEKIFLHYGYQKRDSYFFESKRLNAYWYAPPNTTLPRVFISELIVEDMPMSLRNIIDKYTSHINSDPIDSLDLDNHQKVIDFLHRSLWKVPSYEEYQLLLKHSEYAAWVMYNRYYLNHFTIDVSYLKAPYNNLDSFNTFVKSLDICLNDSGGVIKKSKDGLLLQSSTVSTPCKATFSCGTVSKIAGSYIEFAQRKVLAEFSHLPDSQITSKHRREGFEVSNADKIFESTYTSQINKKPGEIK